MNDMISIFLRFLEHVPEASVSGGSSLDNARRALSTDEPTKSIDDRRSSTDFGVKRVEPLRSEKHSFSSGSERFLDSFPEGNPTTNGINFAVLAMSLCPPTEQRGNKELWRIVLSVLYNPTQYNNFSLGDGGCFTPPSISGEERAWIEPLLDVLTPSMLEKYKNAHVDHGTGTTAYDKKSVTELHKVLSL